MATLAGVASMGSGGVATYVSDNQVGTGVLLLAGAGFLLMGFQGTPLIRIGGKDANIELERRERRAVKAITETEAQEGPERAQQIADVLVSIDPDLARSPAFRTLEYENNVRHTLQRISNGKFVTAPHFLGIDAILEVDSGKIAFEFKSFQKATRISASIVEHIVHRWHSGTIAESGYTLFILVANVPLTDQAKATMQSWPDVRFVLWRNNDDDNALREAIESI